MKNRMCIIITVTSLLLPTNIWASMDSSLEIGAKKDVESEEAVQKDEELRKSESIMDGEMPDAFEDEIVVEDENESEFLNEPLNDTIEKQEDAPPVNHEHNNVNIGRNELGERAVVQSSRATIPGKWIKGSNGRWWYRHNDGGYTSNGWELINNKWYYFDSGGWMVTGWNKIKEKWYYLNLGDDGSMATGWNQIKGKWYYLNLGDDGSMVTGWKQFGADWYYFRLGDDGSMVTGWNRIGSHWYYFNTGGSMRTSMLTVTSGGTTQRSYFRGNGEWRYTTSLLNWHLVDSGRHLDWSGTSVFRSHVVTAAGRWNALRAGVIRQDTASTVNDVTISDYRSASSTRAVTSADGTLRFNLTRMSTTEPKDALLRTAMHELGHALGLGHNETADVMFANPNGVTTATENDRESYRASYARY